jgi:hypothetical protein
MSRQSCFISLFIATATPVPAAPRVPAQELQRSVDPQVPELCIRRIRGEIHLDGQLSEPAWEEACRVEEWFEISPGDNVPPKVKSTGYLAHDDHNFYAGFDFQDPEPRTIRTPLGDHDSLQGYMDQGGVYLDTRGDGKTALGFLATPGGIQYDSIQDDIANNEDGAPDYYWESAARVTETGWTLEMRIPFSSLRYAERNPDNWHIILMRAWPREFRYVMMSTTWPRGLGCMVCRANPLRGLRDLPPGGRLVVAPYLSGRRQSQPTAGLGSPLASDADHADLGADAKWTPAPGHAVDLTANPDFSQIEADVAQIGVNERFALLYPEKRPFFLEGRDLLSTPIQAIYTRAVTSPRWGGRATGRFGTTSYTALVARDEGGGTVILPGPTGSSTAEQDFRSYALSGRVRHDLGHSFVSFLATAREIDGGGHNRVFGPDFQWRPSLRDTVTGQLLLSSSVTPQRPDLSVEWDGRHLSGHASELLWQHSTAGPDWLAQYTDISDGFRADNGFVPQVGYRQTYGVLGWSFWPQAFVRKLRPFASVVRSTEPAGDLLNRQISFGVEFRARWESSGQIRLNSDRVLTGNVVLPRTQLLYDLAVSPSRRVAKLSVSGSLGQAIDFDNHRAGSGADVTVSASLRPFDHLELRLDASLRSLDVPVPTGAEGRLFTAGVQRLRATYTFTPRCFLRLVTQYVETQRDPALYTVAVPRRSASLSVSGLFAYKLNWQTVLFLGYGDERALAADDRLAPARRDLFLKLSYAFQR